MTGTDPALVNLLLDTAHLRWSGDDPLDMARVYAKRIKHVHCKDVRLAIATRARDEGWTFREGIEAGVFTVPGDGDIDFRPILETLSDAGYRGWLMVEAEQDARKAHPLTYAKTARAYLREVTGTMNKPRVPRFAEQLVEANLKDGYWIQAVDIDGDGRPDLVASGLALGEVISYQNPTWKKRRIAKMDKPVAIDAADIAGAGCNDLVISHDYGECMFGCRPQDGKISWLRNPGHPDGRWEVRPIGDLLATHRLRLGQFTQTKDLELLALPVVGPQGKSEGVHFRVRVTLFTRPHGPLRAGEWPRRVVDESRYLHHPRRRTRASSPAVISTRCCWRARKASAPPPL